jgi:hypothetical protein
MKQKIALFLCVIFTLALIAVGCASGTDEVIQVGDDSVASLYSVVGERKVTGSGAGIENGVSKKSLTYSGVTQEDVQSYIDALEAQGYVQILETEQSGTAQHLQMATESVKAGNVVIVDIVFDPMGSTELTYMAGEGTLTRY